MTQDQITYLIDNCVITKVVPMEELEKMSMEDLILHGYVTLTTPVITTSISLEAEPATEVEPAQEEVKIEIAPVKKSKKKAEAEPVVENEPVVEERVEE